MTNEITALSQSLSDLRRQFDDAFAAPPHGLSIDRHSLITLRTAGEALAVRAPHITGLAKTRHIVRVPANVPGLLGITAIRGALLPVYDLAALLELPGRSGAGSWLLLTGPETPLGLLFDEFEGQTEIEPAGLFQNESASSSEHLRLMARIGSAHRAVIDIPGIVERIRKTAGLLNPAKE